MHYYKGFAAIALIIFFCSCSKLDGKIETREGNKVYLVNTSQTKAFKFTVKNTEIINDSLYKYHTQLIELSPGDETMLGFKETITSVQYPLKEMRIFKPYTDIEYSAPVKSVSPIKHALPSFNEVMGLKDTVINGDTILYEYVIEKIKDTLHPLPVDRFKYKYEVTGQLEIKFSPKKEKDTPITN